MTIDQVARILHETANEHGFWADKYFPDYIPEKLMLIVTECAEAMEEYRKGMYNGVYDELIDVLIRTLDMLATFTGLHGDYILESINQKNAYNKTRPYKHGKMC